MRGRTERTEHVAVEALAHILSTSEAARAALTDVVAEGGASVGPIVRVQTQDTGETGARPDLAGFDESGLDRVLIEAKFAASLGLFVPVPIPVHKEYDAVLEEVVERLEGVAQLLDGS